MPDLSLKEVLEAHRAEVVRLAFNSPIKELRKILEETRAYLIKRLQTVPRGTFDAQRLTLFKLQVDTSLKFFTDQLAGRYPVWADALKFAAANHIVGTLNIGAKVFKGSLTIIPMEEAAIFARSFPHIDSSLMQRFSTYTTRYAISTIRRVEQHMAQGLLADKTTDEVISDIMDDSSLGGVFKEPWKVERIVRTELSHVYNQTFLEQSKSLSKADDDIVLRWTELVDDVTKAPLDHRVGKDSIALHGQLRRPGMPFNDIVLGGAPIAPPNRPHDRGRLTIVRKSWGVVP